MQVLIACALFEAVLLTNSGSAKNGRAIETISASPRSIMSLATLGSLIRLVAITGMLMWSFIFCVTQLNAARGTLVAMVGTRASCQPIPVLMMVAPAASISLPRVTTSSQVLPCSIKSSIDKR